MLDDDTSAIFNLQFEYRFDHLLMELFTYLGGGSSGRRRRRRLRAVLADAAKIFES
jgi:hypothetical protein